MVKEEPTGLSLDKDSQKKAWVGLIWTITTDKFTTAIK
jgi:hypothetical protein